MALTDTDFRFSPMQAKVAALLAEGKMNCQIAGELRINEQTVKWHMTRILDKTRAKNRTNACAILIRNGW